MGKTEKVLSCEEWLIFVFDHPEGESKFEWFWYPAAEYWNCPPVLTIEYLTRAFENTETLFQPYNNGQLNQGLWYLVSNSFSNHMFALRDLSVPWSARERCIRSIYTLY